MPQTIADRYARAEDPVYLDLLGHALSETGNDLDEAISVADMIYDEDHAIHYDAKWRRVQTRSNTVASENTSSGERVYDDGARADAGAKGGEEEGGGGKPPTKPAETTPAAQPPPQANPPSAPAPAPQTPAAHMPEGTGDDQAVATARVTVQQVAAGLKSGRLDAAGFQQAMAEPLRQAVQAIGPAKAAVAAKAALTKIAPVTKAIAAHVAAQVQPKTMAVTATEYFSLVVGTYATDWISREAMIATAMAGQTHGAMGQLFGESLGSLASPSATYWAATIASSAIVTACFKIKAALRARRFGQLRQQVQAQRQEGLALQHGRKELALHYAADGIHPGNMDYGQLRAAAGWAFEQLHTAALALGIDDDRVPSIEEIERELVSRQVENQEVFDLPDEGEMDAMAPGAGTPVDTGRDNGGTRGRAHDNYSRRDNPRQYAKDQSREDAAVLANLLGGYALGTVMFIPDGDDGKHQRLLRTQVVTIHDGDDVKAVRGPVGEHPERTVVIDNRDRHGEHDLHFRYGMGPFALDDATPIQAGDDGFKKLVGLIREDRPRVVEDGGDPMAGADQYAKAPPPKGNGRYYISKNGAKRYVHG